VRAIEQFSSQPLPDPKLVFPWLHGLHAENQMQLGFFVARKKALRKVPQCLRGLAIVKAGGDLSTSKLKGAIAPEELMLSETDPNSTASFLEIDPKDGFSVRNFQIQACKMATVSDIVVYGDDSTPRDDVLKLAKSISQAQKLWKEKMASTGCETNNVHTFVVSGKSLLSTHVCSGAKMCRFIPIFRGKAQRNGSGRFKGFYDWKCRRFL
jgi:dual specificity MAP kinase phosphatase